MKGYDKTVNDGIVFDMDCCEGAGNPNDSARPHHPLTMSGSPSWSSLANGTGYLDFNSGHPDYVQCTNALSADLDFTSGSFSTALWFNIDSIAANTMLMSRGNNLAVFDGWYYYTYTDGRIYFNTMQAGVAQWSNSTPIVISTWYLFITVRVGASIRLYINGIDKTEVAGTHINPATSSQKFHIGIAANDVSLPFDGKIASARIWNRALSAAEIYYLFQRERYYYGI